MRKLAVTLLAALAMVLSALAVTGTAQAATPESTPESTPTTEPTTGSTTSPTTAEPTPAPTDDSAAAEEQAAAEKAAAEKAAAEKAAKEKAAKEKAAKKKAAKKKAAAKARKKRAQQRALRTWNRLAHCESTSRWHVDTGNGYYGGLQISPSTWRSYGGARFAGLPHQASKMQQIKVGKRIKDGQGWGAWPSCSRQLGLR